MRLDRSIRNNLFLAITVTLVIFGSLECVARIRELFVSPTEIDLNIGFSEDTRIFVPDPDDESFLRLHPVRENFFVQQRFLRRPSPDVFRVAIFGGSSINFAHGDFQRMVGKVNANEEPGSPKIEILNFGGLAYGSGRLLMALAESLSYEPHLLIVYSGHNEFVEFEQMKLADPYRTKLFRWAFTSAFVRLLRDYSTRMFIKAAYSAENVAVLRRAKLDLERAYFVEFSGEEVDNRMKAYSKNLSSMVWLAKAKQIPIVLSTVPSNLMDPRLLEKDRVYFFQNIQPLYSEGRYQEGAERTRELLSRVLWRHQASPVENSIIRQIAEEERVPLIDMERVIGESEPHSVPGETLFMDWCHLNQAGNEILASTFREVIVEFSEESELTKKRLTR